MLPAPGPGLLVQVRASELFGMKDQFSSLQSDTEQKRL